MVKCNKKIAILLATYNGADYLDEQIGSLFSQSNSDWQLFVHDDGSTDDTSRIIYAWKTRYPERIILLDYPSQRSACRNFISLLETVEADYYMFCDQDDVWNINKVEIEFRRMLELERELSYSCPIIIHTDLCVVDAGLRTICPSFWKYQNIHPEWYRQWQDFVWGSYVTGCTMLFNNAAKMSTLPLSEYSIMHDAWIALSVASTDGIIESMDVATVSYRQHKGNTVGAHRSHSVTLWNRLRHIRKDFPEYLRYYRQMNSVRGISLFHFFIRKWAGKWYRCWTPVYKRDSSEVDNVKL